MHILLVSGLMWYLSRDLRGVSETIAIQDKSGKVFCLLHTNHGVWAAEETWKTANKATFAWTILDCLTHEVVPYVLGSECGHFKGGLWYALPFVMYRCSIDWGVTGNWAEYVCLHINSSQMEYEA